MDFLLYLHLSMFPLMTVVDLLEANWGWIVVALIVVLGLLVAGASDVMRFSLTRAWAISGVCFYESLRKRVLWIAPLAIIGVIGVTQFQRAFDEQDAVRQSLKVCLFATALLVMLVSIILACTNLPKEIETRVIYTVVTKPVTRLELILGKVMGFARVSLAIIVIMGIFTWLYMHFCAHEKEQQIAYRLQEGDVSDTERGRLIEYQRTGLLTARQFWAADQLGMFGAPPNPNSSIRVISNADDEDVVAAYPVKRAVLFGPPTADPEDWAHQGIGQNGLVIRVMLNSRRTGKAMDQPSSAGQVYGPSLASQHAPTRLLPPGVTLQIMDEGYFDLYNGPLMVGGSSPADLVHNIVQYTKTGKIDPAHAGAYERLSEPVKLPDGSTTQYAYAWLPPQAAMGLFNRSMFNVRVIGASTNVDYLIGPHPIDCFIPDIQPGRFDIDGPHATRINPFPGESGDESLIFRGHVGIHYDQEMSGGTDAPEATADFSFRNSPPPSLGSAQRIPFQLSVQLERSNSDIESGHEDATMLAVRVIDDATKKVTNLANPVPVESKLPAYFTIPAGAVTSGNFDILFHCRSEQVTVGMMPDSLQLILAYQPFVLNLIKSLSIVWMMSILVIILAVMCSTFVSWPIAIVLTVLLLLGHWGVDQLADESAPGLGRQIVNDFKFTDVPLANLVSTGVDTLSRILNGFSQVLPDTSKFDAIADIEQGVSISSERLLEALTVLGAFGVPSIVLAYVLLRNKEVAP